MMSEKKNESKSKAKAEDQEFTEQDVINLEAEAELARQEAVEKAEAEKAKKMEKVKAVPTGRMREDRNR